VTLDDQVTAGPGVVYSVTVLAATGAAAAPQSIHDDVTGDVADSRHVTHCGRSAGSRTKGAALLAQLLLLLRLQLLLGC